MAGQATYAVVYKKFGYMVKLPLDVDTVKSARKRDIKARRVLCGLFHTEFLHKKSIDLGSVIWQDFTVDKADDTSSGGNPDCKCQEPGRCPVHDA